MQKSKEIIKPEEEKGKGREGKERKDKSSLRKIGFELKMKSKEGEKRFF